MKGEGALVSMPINPIWDSVKQEIELARAVAGAAIKYHAEYALLVVFDEIPFVGGEPVLDVLNYFVRIVEEILSALETEARRIGLVN
jgi:hypothetical protein